MVQTMTTKELIYLLIHCDRNIYLSDAFTTYNEDFIIQKFVSYTPTTQTIFQFEPDGTLIYFDYFLHDLKNPNFYGNRYIALPKKPGIKFDYAYCDEKSMLNLLDKRIRQYEEVLKEVKQKNKEWKMGKDFE